MTFDGEQASVQEYGAIPRLQVPAATISLSFELDTLWGHQALISADVNGHGSGEFTVWIDDGKLVVA
ncbi:hypothetical protein ATO11_19030, partial [Pseudaestuariivita atlantica]